MICVASITAIVVLFSYKSNIADANILSTSRINMPLEDLATINSAEPIAHFKITKDLANKNIKPLSFTVSSFGNTLQQTGKGSFEPATFRTSFIATEDHDNRIFNDTAIHYWDSYATGYLNGATVRIFRMINGNLKLVRRGKVAESPIEYWNFINDSKLLDPSISSAQFKWAPWSRPKAKRWFTLVAVDKAGNLSKLATPLLISRSQPAQNAEAHNQYIDFKAQFGLPIRPSQPQNFSAEINDQGIVYFNWSSVDDSDLAGYRIAFTDTNPKFHRGVYLELAETKDNAVIPIKKGDMIFVSKSLETFSTDWISNRIGGLDRLIREFIPDRIPNNFYPSNHSKNTWSLKRHKDKTAVENPGEFYLEMTLDNDTTKFVGKSGIPDISTTSQEYYPVPQDGTQYIAEVWIKADQNTRAPVIFTWEGDKRVGGFVGEHELIVTDEWTKHTVRFEGKSTDKGHHAYFVLKTKGPGTYSFDNFRVYQADTDFLDFKPYQYQQLAKSGMASLRTHGTIKSGRTTYTMDQYLRSAGEAEGIGKGNTLPQMLNAIKKANMVPWLQIEFHMSDEEWLQFAEYIAAPYNYEVDTPELKPFAYRRVQQGQKEPWINEFEKIYFELGNETWNGLFSPWVFSDMPDASSLIGKKHKRGEVYGKMHDRVVGILRSSPYWSEQVDEKFKHVLGGWAIGNYSYEAASSSKTADYITIAAYNGGWDENEELPKFNANSFFNVLMNVNQVAIPRAQKFVKMVEDLQREGRNIKLGTYEAGPGYVMNGLNGARVSKEQQTEQELVMKSKLAGTATLDSFLARAYLGFELQNFFTFAEGDFWKSHSKQYRGGQAHASYLPLELFNKYAQGDMLISETLTVPTADLNGFARREEMAAQPLAAVYATKKNKRVVLFCISRIIPDYPNKGSTGYTPFKLNLPFTTAETIKLYRMSGEYTDNNIERETVKVETLEINNDLLSSIGEFKINESTGGSADGLPPAEVFIYVFEGTNIQ